jgi:hypothetical protein
MKVTAPVYCFIIGLYLLVAGILVWPLLRFVERHAALSSSFVQQNCLFCPRQLAKSDFSTTVPIGSSEVHRTGTQEEGLVHPISLEFDDRAAATLENPNKSDGYEASKRRHQFMAKVLVAQENSIPCRKARSMISDAFSDVQTRSCMGKVYRFEATGKRQRFLIKVYASSGKLVEKPKAIPEMSNLE